MKSASISQKKIENEKIKKKKKKTLKLHNILEPVLGRPSEKE
jgi:hypothetical protein